MTERGGADVVAALPVGPAKTAKVRSMFDAIAPRYDMVNRIMTFGLDQGWRKTTVEALALPDGSVILDLATGTGDLSRMAENRHRHRVIGADLSWGMLAANTTGRPLVQTDAAHLPLASGSLDGVLCGYALRNFTDLAGSLGEAARVLRPGGRIAVLEVAAPPRGVMRAGYKVWFEHAVPVLGGLLSDKDAYHYLPKSTAYLPPANELRALFRQAGFSTVGHRLLHGGLSQLITATRAGTLR